MSAIPPALAPALIPPIPDDALIFEAAAFGRVAFFEPGAPKAVEKGAPRQIVVTMDGAFVLPNKAPMALRTRIRDAIEALEGTTLGPFGREFLSGASFLRSPNAVTVWWPPVELDVTCLREASVGSSLDPAVDFAITAIAAHLAKEIDEPMLVAAARRHFGLPDQAEDGWLLVGERYSAPDMMQEYEVNQVCSPFLGAFAQTTSFRLDVEVLLSTIGVSKAEFIAPPTELPAQVKAPCIGVADAHLDATLFTRPSERRGGRLSRREKGRSAPLISRAELVNMVGGEERHAWVLPRYWTPSRVVEEIGLMAGIPVIASSSWDELSLPQLRLGARRIGVSSMLHALVADELVLVVLHPDRATEVLQVVTSPVLDPWTVSGAVDDQEHWAPDSMADAQRAGAVLRELGVEPTRLLLGPMTHLADQTEVPAVVLSTLLLGVNSPLPLTEFARRRPHINEERERVHGVDVVVVETPAYQRALRAAVLLETEGDTFSPMQRIAERMIGAADGVEATVGAALREARDLGAPADLLRVIAAPAAGLIAALRATTIDRLHRLMGSGEIMLNTLLSDPPPSLVSATNLDLLPVADLELEEDEEHEESRVIEAQDNDVT